MREGNVYLLSFLTSAGLGFKETRFQSTVGFRGLKLYIHGKAVPIHLEGFAPGRFHLRPMRLSGSIMGRTALTASLTPTVNPIPKGYLAHFSLRFQNGGLVLISQD
ncbi:hypothetical protein AVEN_257827-1 [Araneus ventricosus]|uniref:Uncharacterized protein n=1 Tax=Araneus ventricosus TaxID=182803 RepID=A0A4Y2M883_ARAVE|nr:hypothetical protein AVEN_257827-1 [Araneus ventricosus]